MPKFDFNHVAREYDDFYQTPVGKKIDHVEKREISPFLTKLALSEPCLEIGCGTGHWTEFFNQKGMNIMAIDISEEMLKIASVKIGDRVKFRKMKAEELEFSDGSFTNVITIATLEFVDDRNRVRKEIDRVLKPGGFLLAGCLNELSSIGKRKDENEVYRNADFFSPDTLKSFLSAFGSPEIRGCAVIEGEKVLDYPDDHNLDDQARLGNGAFLIGLVKKTE